MNGDLAGPSVPIKAFAAEDPATFEQFIARYHTAVFAVCLSFLHHRQDAEDATQETFSRFYRYRRRFDSSRPVEPYLKRIAGNRCRTLLSRRRSNPSLVSIAEPHTDVARLQDKASQLSEELRLALGLLPKRHREAFEKFHVVQMSYAEIADSMNCPIGSVKTWVHRARGQLMDELSRREAVTPPSSSARRKQPGGRRDE